VEITVGFGWQAHRRCLLGREDLKLGPYGLVSLVCR
jgi:hypothetical protein